jgi:hypothetical protein
MPSREIAANEIKPFDRLLRRYVILPKKKRDE